MINIGRPYWNRYPLGSPNSPSEETCRQSGWFHSYIMSSGDTFIINPISPVSMESQFYSLIQCCRSMNLDADLCSISQLSVGLEAHFHESIVLEFVRLLIRLSPAESRAKIFRRNLNSIISILSLSSFLSISKGRAFTASQSSLNMVNRRQNE